MEYFDKDGNLLPEVEIEMEICEQLDELEFELEGIIDTLRKTLGLPEFCYVCGNLKVTDNVGSHRDPKALA